MPNLVKTLKDFKNTGDVNVDAPKFKGLLKDAALMIEDLQRQLEKLTKESSTKIQNLLIVNYNNTKEIERLGGNVKKTKRNNEKLKRVNFGITKELKRVQRTQ